MVDKAGGEGGEGKEPITIDVPDAPEPQDTGKPSLSDLADLGLSQQEIKMAQDRGMIGDGEGEGDGGKKPDPKPQDKGGGNNGKEEEKEKPERLRIITEGKSPEQIIREVGEKGDLSPEQEAALLATLTQNGQGLYFTQKKERKARQAAETDRDVKVQQKEAEIAELKKKLEDAEKARLKAEAANTGDDADDDDPLGLDGGKPKKKPAAAAPPEETDPKKKPLTEEDLDRREKEKQDKARKDAEALAARKAEIKEALNDQEAAAQQRYKDFDTRKESAASILNAFHEGRLAELFPDARERSRITRDCNVVMHAITFADQFESGDFDVADMMYELGKNLPQKPNANGGSKRGETENGNGNAEDTERALRNATRRGSSAALNSGGSRRSVNVDELTEEQAARVPTTSFNKLPKATRERLLGKS